MSVSENGSLVFARQRRVVSSSRIEERPTNDEGEYPTDRRSAGNDQSVACRSLTGPRDPKGRVDSGTVRRVQKRLRETGRVRVRHRLATSIQFDGRVTARERGSKWGPACPAPRIGWDHRNIESKDKHRQHHESQHLASHHCASRLAVAIDVRSIAPLSPRTKLRTSQRTDLPIGTAFGLRAASFRRVRSVRRCGRARPSVRYSDGSSADRAGQPCGPRLLGSSGVDAR